MRLGFAALFGCVALSSAAAAPSDGPTGLWNRDDGLGGVRIVACGEAFCGRVVWVRDKDGPARIGQRVLFGLRKTAANTWSGSAVNPADGQTYSGTLTLSGARMVTRGCAAGGMICQTIPLSRAH